MNPYLEAAEMLFNGDPSFSCAAISHVGKSAEDYAQMFCPEGFLKQPSWLCDASMAGLLKFTEMREWRLTALCFAAAMYESGDLE